MTEQCGNCRFWLKRTDHAGDAGGGFCRRYPPIHPGAGWLVHKFYHSGRDSDYTIEADNRVLNDGWPYVHQQEWCGEFQAKP
jgi:hypothetical protein